MNDNPMEEITNKLRKFNKDRDWGKHHNPKDLAISISLEAAEVLEKFQWKTGEKITSEQLEELRDELADVMIYLIQMADVLKIDLLKAVDRKIGKNAIKYPIEKSKGNATKYNKL